MSWFTDLFGPLLAVRQDPPALPGPVLATRQDTGSSVVNPLSGLGGWADKGAAGRPNPYVQPLQDAELRALYAYNGVARRIVDLLPGRATRRGWTVSDVPASEDKRLRTWARAREVMSMARLGGGAVLLMVTEDDVPTGLRGDPSAWLREPLDLERVGALHALQVFDWGEAAPAAWETDIASPGWRMPSLWNLWSATGWSATVHASRVVHFRGARRPPSEVQGSWQRSNTMPDDSALQAVWDEIRRLSETMAGGAALAGELRHSVLKVNGLASSLAGDQAKAFQTRVSVMTRLRSMLNMTVVDAGDDFLSQSNAPTGFSDLSEGAQMMLTTALGWPRSMLTGEAPGGLSTDDKAGQERERQIVSDYQETHREELEALYTVIYAAQDGPTRGRPPDEWALEFTALDEPDEKDQAELRKTVAETDAIYITSGVYGPESVLESRFGENGWSLEMTEVEPPDEPDEAAIQAAIANMAAPPDPPGAPPEPPEPPRDDAADGVCVLVPAAGVPQLLDAVQRAIGQVLAGRDPHVTLLYLGAVPGGTDEVAAVVAELAADTQPAVLERGVVRAFPHDTHGTPVVVEFEDGWAVSGLHDALLRRLAHLVSARQHPRYRAHLTLGYAPEPLSPEALTALLAVSAEDVRVPVAMVQVVVGGAVVSAVPVGG